MPWDTIADKFIGNLIKKTGLAGPAKIEGIVKDSNHKPVPEVIVTIGGKQNTTAMSGNYIIIDPSTGLQSISLEYKGKVIPNVHQIAIERGDKIELDLLAPDSLTEQLGTKQQSPEQVVRKDTDSSKPLNLQPMDIKRCQQIRDTLEKIQRGGEQRKPIKIWFGKTGAGTNPNFQIEFEDGKIQPYYNSGRPFAGISAFNEARIIGPFIIKDCL